MRYSLPNNFEVAHRWANQTQSHAYCGNISFNGVYGYSYNTPVARLHTVNGYKVAVISDVFYSITTAKHKSDFDAAASHHIVLRCKAGIDDVKTALLETQERVINEIMGVFNQRKTFRDLCSFTSMADNFDICAYKLGYPDLALAIPTEFWVVLAEQLRSMKQAEDTRRLEREERERKQAEEALPTWLAGGPAHSSLRILTPQLIRVKDDRVETTRGASVSLLSAQMALDAIMPIIDGMYIPAERIVGTKIDGYEVTAITGDTITIGCHTLDLNQCNRVLRKEK